MHEGSERTPPRRVPVWFVVIAAAVLAVGAAVTLVGAYQIGITWDERTNMRSLQVFFEQGWNITEDALINGQPDPNYIWGIYVYGPVSLLFTHALAVLAGAEEWALSTRGGKRAWTGTWPSSCCRNPWCRVVMS